MPHKELHCIVKAKVISANILHAPPVINVQPWLKKSKIDSN